MWQQTDGRTPPIAVGVNAVARQTSDYTQSEVASQNLQSRYDRHFVGKTWHNVWN